MNSLFNMLKANEKKMSPRTLHNWQMKKIKHQDLNHPLGFDLTIEDFYECIREAAIYAQNQQFALPAEKPKDGKKVSTVFGVHTTEAEGEEEREDSQQDKFPGGKKKCPLCEKKPHKELINCPKLKEMSSYDINRWIKQRKCKCRKCFALTHSSPERTPGSF